MAGTGGQFGSWLAAARVIGVATGIATIWFGFQHCDRTAVSRFVTIELPVGAELRVDGDVVERRLSGAPGGFHWWSVLLDLGEHRVEVHTADGESLDANVEVGPTDRRGRRSLWRLERDDEGLWLDLDAIKPANTKVTGG